jgi:hypothetical protein
MGTIATNNGMDLIHFCGFNGHVDGSLHLYNTQITELPSNLNVGGNLDLSDTQITELPSDVKVGGYVWVGRCGVPKGTKKPEGVKGDLHW